VTTKKSSRNFEVPCLPCVGEGIDVLQVAGLAEALQLMSPTQVFGTTCPGPMAAGCL
jgi:hypothetical protein